MGSAIRPVADLRLRTGELSAKRRLVQVGVEHLDVRGVRRGRLEVARGSRGDAGLPAVRDDERAVQRRQLSDSTDLGEAAATVDVRLEHVDASALEPLTALVDGGCELSPADSCLDPLGEPRMAGEVVMAQRRLGEVDVAVLDPAERPERVAPVAPAVAEVEHHRDLVAEEPASLANALDEARVGRRDPRTGPPSSPRESRASSARSKRAAMSSIICADRPAGDRAGVDRRVRRDRRRASRHRAAGRRGGASCFPTRSWSATSIAEAACTPRPRRAW